MKLVNLFYSILFNNNTPSPSGIYVDLNAHWVVPDALLPFWRTHSNGGIVDADKFAVLCTKVVSGSTYRSEITDHDSRMTFDPVTVLTDTTNVAGFIGDIISKTPPGVVSYVSRKNEDISETLFNERQARIIQDSAAAIIAGVVREVVKYNGA